MLLLRVQATCSDKDGPSGGGTSPVTDTDCGPNYVYDPSKSAASCAGATCNTSDVDQQTCCMVEYKATCGDKDGPVGTVTAAVNDADCGNGYVYDPSASTTNCTGSTCDPSGVDRDTCCSAVTCPKGQGFVAGSATKDASCSDCIAGQYSAADDASPCSAHNVSSCPSGEGWNGSPIKNDATCSACTAGKYSSAADANACVPCKSAGCLECPADKGTPCTKCGSNKYLSNDTTCCDIEGCDTCINGTTCDKCIAGRYGPTKFECLLAPSGAYTNQPGRRTYIGTMCGPGTIGELGQTSPQACDNCTRGKFQNSTGMSECTGCADGTVAEQTGQVACKSCDDGMVSNSESTNCVCFKPCPRGKFGKVAPNCTDCPAGTYFAAVGGQTEDDCNLCSPGRWRAGTGGESLQSCTECERGKYQDVPGSPEPCKQCRRGVQYQNQIGQPGCKDSTCKAGTFGVSATDPTMKPRCSTCGAGTYNPGRGRSECSDCPPGRWGDTLGATTIDACEICRGGMFGNTSGATTKQCSGMCPPGKYSDDGYKQCLLCSSGKFNRRGNSTICLSCSKKMTTLGEGSTMCVCEKGSYMNGNGTCVGCPDEIKCDKDGSTLESVDLKSGSWRPNAKSDAIYECPVEDSCLGGNSTDTYVVMFTKHAKRDIEKKAMQCVRAVCHN